MVEELKLAIKVDDDAIEQSLLKQFANAEKMANKVVLTFNNIDLDDKAIEAKFKEMQKMAGKNPIDLSIDKSSIEMLSAISKQLGNIFDIAKGKSIIDSSATVSEINKITQATKELNKAQTGSENIQSKSFTTKNKTEAYNQLKQTADTFKQFYGNEEAMHTKAGTEAAYAYYKAYEEALKKGVAESKLQRVTVDVNPTDSFFTADRISSTRIKEFADFEKYGEETTALSEEISYFEKRLLKFSEAYSQIQSKLGKAPITPEIIQNIEEYVRNLEIAEARTKDADLMGFTKEDIDLYRDSANMYLGFATEDAIRENEKYISSLKEVKEEKENVDVSLSKSQISDIDSSLVEQQNKIQEELKETQKQAEQTSESLSNIGDGNKSNISSENPTVEISQNDEVVASIRKKKEELASYELRLEETRYEIEKLSKAENESFGFNRSHTKKEQISSLRDSVARNIFGKPDNGGRSGQKKWFALGDISNIDSSVLKSYQMWNEELSKAGYKLSEIRAIGKDGLEADIIPIDGKAITNAEEFRKALDNITTAPSENVELLNKQVSELESKISSLKAEIALLQSNQNSPMKDVIHGGTTSAEKLEEEIKNIDSATEKASESAKEYRKILSQVGEFDIDSKVSAMYKRNDGQLESWTWRAKKDDEGNVLYDQNGKIDYDEPTITVISKYEQLEKIIVKADNELRNLQKDLAEIKAYDPTASTTNIEAKISDQKEYIQLLEQTVKAISQSDEYLLDEQQIIEARNKAAREYALTTGAKQEKTDAKQSASDEKKRLANIEQVNRALNKQQITIDAIEKTYNKTTNPDLDREVSNQQDLAELAQKKLAIQTKINSLQGKERNSANEKEFLELEKLIAEYKELAKYKLKANNPSKQELGGQNLQTLIQVQISNYDKLITKAEKYGDATSDTIEKLKEQRDILSKIGSDGKYSATADQYYASRDTYKVESAALSAFEAETRAIEQKTQAIKKLSDELEVYNKQVPKKPADGQRSDKFEGLVQNYKNAISEAQKYLNTLGNSPVTEEVKKEWESLINVIKKAKEEMDSVATAERGSDALSRGKEIDTITKYLNKFTGISKQARRELNGLLDQLQSGDPSVNVKKIHERFLELTVAERNAGREARNLFDIFKDKKIYSFLGQAASMFSFYDLVNVGREGFQTIRELDTALTEMKKVSDETTQSLKNYQSTTFDVGDAVGATAKTIQNSTADFLRLGESMDEAAKSAKTANILLNVSEFENIDEATESLISMSQAYKELEKSEIVDVANKLGNEFAISTDGIATALKDSASALKTAQNDFYEASALAVAANTVVQDPSKVGAGKFMPEYIVICRYFIYQKVAISVKNQGWSRPREGYNIC